MEPTTEDEKSRPPLIPQPHPWLLIHHGKHSQWQTFYSISEDRCYLRKVPELCNTRICSSHSHGWLVLEHLESNECFLLNPVSMEKIQLPLREPQYDVCVLTCPPSDPDCRVIFISQPNHSLSFCKLGDNEVNTQVLDAEDVFACATTFEGKLYGLLQCTSTLVVLDFSGPRPHFRKIMSETSLHNLSPPYIICSGTFMVESGGELLLVHQMFRGYYMNEVFGFSIYRIDLFGKTWVKVKSIGERAIFLDTFDGMSFSAAADSGIRGNSIYFTLSRDRCLYVFDLENQTISISLPCSNVSRRDSSLHWVMMPIKNNLSHTGLSELSRC